MELDADSLEPYIAEILSAPGTDLATISAKRVRRQLQLVDPALTPELLKANRVAVDAVITRVFERVQQEGGGVSSIQGYEDSSPPPQQAVAPLPKKKSSQEASDAELARQLSSEINGRTRRSNGNAGSGGTRAGSGTPRKRKAKKSAALVDTDDDDDDSDGSGGKPAKKQKRSEGGTARGGFAKPYLLSEPLAAVLGTDSLSRPQVVKQLWVYIKANELQNPNNKREILCDGALRPVFNVDKIDMFKMNKVLGQHLHEIES
ncbi:SWIB/MDM2 domain protein [Mycena indigotica]|uniref:SWIB/MDM2 domain protein n=1 Tax=Mycena indigotica TaxID=2126181 RepID=A0A8H6TG48_9AGAR|nr:SWIB/MDM2 domain protein [Mycena indigotica]KAF7315130.1 SWIB/MDM2 domain protein [Mycena indigotica]